MAGGGGKAAWGRCLARITNKCWGHKHAGSASQFSPRVCAAKLGRYAPLFISHVFSTAVAGQGKVVSIGCIGAYRFQF